MGLIKAGLLFISNRQRSQSVEWGEEWLDFHSVSFLTVSLAVLQDSSVPSYHCF